MARVTTPTGQTLEVTSPGALHYYRREPGYTVLDDADGTSAAPAMSANKPEWVEFALTVDPDNAERIAEMTKTELVDRYGG